MLSENATAQLSLTSTTGSGAGTVYHYDITVHDTGTTNIGTFWFGWIVNYDFLPSMPSSTSNPTGWSNLINGANDGADGSSIEWSATSHQITPGNSLSGFSFATADSPATLAADSPIILHLPAMTSFIYTGAALAPGDNGFQFVVTPLALADTTTTVVSSGPTITAGDPVTLTATVAPTSAGATPTGNVTFFENGNSIGSMTVAGNGTAALQTSSLPTGALNITATYNGDTNYNGSTSPQITETVNAAPVKVGTTTTLISSAPAATIGDSVTLTATVTPTTPGATPTGTVSFTQDGNLLATQNVGSDGTAALTTSALPAGTDHITATYSGDSAYSDSASAPFSEAISPPPNAIVTTTALATSSPSAVIGTSVTITATITPATAGAAFTGTVSFSENGTSLGSAPVQGNGTAALTTSSLPSGVDDIVATYTGDSNYASSTSTALAENIAPPPTLLPAIAKSTVPTSLVATIAAHGVVTLEITNETANTIKGKSTLAIFASTTGVIDNSAIPLASALRPFNLKATKSAKDSISVKLLASTLPTGSYTLLARVTDPSANISDSTSGPTVTVAAPIVALSETVVRTTIPTSAVGGAKAHALAILNIANGGNITTPGSTTVALFATLNGVVDNTATPIGTPLTRPLRIRTGKSLHVTISVKQIPAIAVGSYTIVAQIIDGNAQATTVTVGTLMITA